MGMLMVIVIVGLMIAYLLIAGVVWACLPPYWKYTDRDHDPMAYFACAVWPFTGVFLLAVGVLLAGAQVARVGAYAVDRARGRA